MRITASVQIKGGRHLSAANAGRIFARSLRPTDPCGNSLPSPIDRYRGQPPYFQRWAPKKEKQGWIFIEVGNGMGINGHHPTLRALVVSVLLNHSRDIVVEFV